MSLTNRILAVGLGILPALTMAACKPGTFGSHVKVEPAPAVSYEQFMANERFAGDVFNAMALLVGGHLNPETNQDAEAKTAFLWRHINDNAVAKDRILTADFMCARKQIDDRVKAEIFAAKARFAYAGSGIGKLVMSFVDFDLRKNDADTDRWVPGSGARTEWWAPKAREFPIEMIVWKLKDNEPTSLRLVSPDGATLSLAARSGVRSGVPKSTMFCTEAANIAKIGDPRITVEAFMSGGPAPAATAANQR